MRTVMLIASVAVVLAAAPAAAGGVGAETICSNAGFRLGTVSFQTCVSRVSGDDPLAALETADAERVPVAAPEGEARPLVGDTLDLLESERVKAEVAPVRPPVRGGEFPAVAGASGPVPGGGLPGGGLPGGGVPGGDLPGGGAPPPSAPPPPPPAGGGGFFITPPTAPTPPTPPTLPAWMWGG